MTLIKIYTSLILLSLSFSNTQAEEMILDRIVAVVNSQAILQSEIQDKIRKGNMVSVSEFPAAENASDFEKSLQDSVNLELIKQKAEEMELNVSEADFEQELDRFMQSRGLNRDALIAALRQQGMNFEDYRKDFRDQMLLRKFQGMVIGPLVKISEKEIESYFLRRTGTKSESRKLILKQIFIQVTPGSNKDIENAKSELAGSVFQKLSGGLGFDEAVKLYSDDESTKTKNGLLPELQLKDLSEQLRPSIEKLEIGQFTSPIKTSNGYYIFLLDSYKYAGSDDFKKQRGSIENELRAQEFGIQTRRWLSEQRRRTKVKILEL